jgi:EAL domain-containing protein (putative c-di-GMP-specific phosphodiesterase class I)/PleD family two-component response regulator
MSAPQTVNPIALIADDDPVQRLLMQEALSHDNFRTTAVADGAQAIEQAISCGPSIIFLDVMMPLRTGLEACREIRAALGENCPPIILVTSRDTDDAIAEGFSAGATDYLIKPVNVTLLRHRVRGWLAAHAAAARPARPAADSLRKLLVSRHGTVLSDSEAQAPADAGHEPKLADLLDAPLASQIMVCVRKVLKSREPTSCRYAEWEAAIAAQGREQASVVLRNVSGQSGDAAELYRLAYLDPLTGLPNRHLFERTARSCLTEAQLRDRGLTLLCLTFDRPTVTPASQAAAGPILRVLADQMVSTLRHSDSVVHYDGTADAASPLASIDGVHFLILLAGTGDHQAQSAVLDRVRKACAAADKKSGKAGRMTPRIGVARFPDDADNLELLIEKAIRAASEAREMGESAPRRAGASLAAIEVRADIAGELRHALTARQICLHFQPRIDIVTRRVAGAEALLRWQHPLRGPIAARTLIEMAESAGEATRLTDWALEQACQQARAWAVELRSPVRISVNTTESQLSRPDFSATLVDRLGVLELDPGLLEIEVAESTIDKSESVVGQLLALRDAGVGLIVDDFGSGRSNLASLRRLRIDGFKVNHGHLRSAAWAAEESGIYSLAASIARVRNACVIAKGIETAEELAIAQARGCDQVQGFFVCQPLAAEEFVKYVSGAGLVLGMTGPAAIAS